MDADDELARLADELEASDVVGDDTTRRFVALVRDVLRRAQRDRRRLEAVNDALPGGIIVRSPGGELLWTNRWMQDYAVATLGRERAESAEYELVDEDLRPVPAGGAPSARAGRGESFDGTIVGLVVTTSAGDRELRWLNTSGRPLRDEDGSLVGGLVVVTDVTDRVRFRRQLERSERLLRDAERIARSGSWVRNIETGESVVSDGFRAIAGLGPDEPVSRERLYEVFHEDDRQRIFEGTYRAFHDGVPYRDRLRVIDTAGAMHLVDFEAEQHRSDDGRAIGLVGTIQDVTDDVARDERLAKAERMEMIGRLAGGLAHDFNNLLTVLTGHAELLAASADDSQRASVAAITAATERASALTRQLLEFGRREVLHPRPTRLDEVIAHIEAMARSIVPSSIELRFETSDDALVTVIDPLKIEQVLLNLVLNARDALVDQGEIAVRSAVTEVASGELAELPAGRYCRVDVVDDGPGMPTDVLERAMEPFFTTKPLGSGTGLGLATSSGVVAQSGGSLLLASEPGAGTTATVLLPWSDADPQDAPPSPRSTRVAGPATILLAEDEDALRSLVERALRARGHHVLAGADGQRALELAAETPERIDLLVTDVSMPRRDGHELAVALRAVHPHLRVIYVSGYTETSEIVQGRATGEIDFLAKPFTMAELLDLVDDVLTR